MAVHKKEERKLNSKVFQFHSKVFRGQNSLSLVHHMGRRCVRNAYLGLWATLVYSLYYT